ncbi:MAG: Jag N-terminal domain-containing protein [Clostridia bacterium]|nr:Jag N-terminal domain-containing protein [Clostridia bacterium]
MEKFIITTGKTIDLAIAAALDQLRMDRDSVSVEVLENAKSGFLGFGAQPAKVKVSYEAPDEAPKPALSSASRSKPKKQAADAPAEAPVVIAPAVPAAARPQEVRAEQQPRQPKPERKDRKPSERRDAPKQNTEKPAKTAEKPAKPAEKAEPKVYAPAEPGSTEERIEKFLKGLLEQMGSDAVPHAVKLDDEQYSVELVGSNLGILIGRRGETLDAIQHLTNYAINRGRTKRMRISVDAENYRLKREESLQRLAVKVAGKVTKYRRNITLEPMNAYERHVIHAALQDHPDVTTFSTGTEPNRRIVVAYSRYKNTEFEEK